MGVIKDLVNVEQVNATSKWERLGDFLLQPKSWLWGSQRICVLGNKAGDVYDISPKEKSESKLRKAAGVIGLVLVPFGLMFKGVALLTSERTRTAYLNHEVVVHRAERNKELTTWEKERSIFEKRIKGKDKDQRASADDLAEVDKLRADRERLYGFKFPEIFKRALNDASQTLGFLKSVGREPRAYMAYAQGSMGEAANIIFSFSECACIDGQFNRMLNDRRVTVEAGILSDISSRFPDKNQPLNIMSFGSGHLGNEFVLLGLLVKAGYNNIRFVLIDTYYGEQADRKREAADPNEVSAGSLVDFYRLIPPLAAVGVNFQIESYEDVDKYLADHKEPSLDVIIGIDLNLGDFREKPPLPGEEYERYMDRMVYVKTDLATLQTQALKRDGKMHLALGKCNLKLSKSDNIDKQIEDKSIQLQQILQPQNVGIVTRLFSRFSRKVKPSDGSESDED